MARAPEPRRAGAGSERSPADDKDPRAVDGEIGGTQTRPARAGRLSDRAARGRDGANRGALAERLAARRLSGWAA